MLFVDLFGFCVLCFLRVGFDTSNLFVGLMFRCLMQIWFVCKFVVLVLTVGLYLIVVGL